MQIVSVPVHAQEPAGTAADPATGTPDAATVEAEGITEANELVRNGRYSEAAEVLAELVGDDTDKASLLAFYGEVLVAAGDADKAVAILGRAIAANPAATRVHFQLATAQTSLGNVDEALQAYAREIEINEDPEVRFLAHVNRSILLANNRRYDEAAVCLEQGLELKPDDQPQAYGELATLYLKSSQALEAAAALERGAAVGFRSARLYFNVGARLFNDKRYAEAEQAFSRALEIDAEMADAERSLAAVLSQVGRDDEARRHLARYLELRPDAPDADEIKEHLAALTD